MGDAIENSKKDAKKVLVIALVSLACASIMIVIALIYPGIKKGNLDAHIASWHRESYPNIDIAGLTVKEACDVVRLNGWDVAEKITLEDNYTSEEVSCDLSNEWAIVKKYAYSKRDHVVKMEFAWKTPENYENEVIGKKLSEACDMFVQYGWKCAPGEIEDSYRTGSKYLPKSFDINDQNAFVKSMGFFANDIHMVYFYIDPDKYMELTGENLLKDENWGKNTRNIIRR